MFQEGVLRSEELAKKKKKSGKCSSCKGKTENSQCVSCKVLCYIKFSITKIQIICN